MEEAFLVAAGTLVAGRRVAVGRVEGAIPVEAPEAAVTAMAAAATRIRAAREQAVPGVALAAGV